jgi:hypothetical protein
VARETVANPGGQQLLRLPLHCDVAASKASFTSVVCSDIKCRGLSIPGAEVDISSRPSSSINVSQFTVAGFAVASIGRLLTVM